ncbi:RNA-binding cell elongation regulator Jag/EloR [Desulfocurvus sp.]|uniref:RNA-binding cell elongation regulator Jag/EloR n=1 Tax=Desulfocurvus sp. TaxID=2871698 RepID=UPI0025C30074|nr:RNA-binding cell elongation regulator Jag/EloR [Desulfocurvus sp.]MCK9239432.1 Jag N-terminal domain-containing protein [Desulfocurvus sp.]
MTRFTEFTGKTLDEAIENALGAFGVPREKLEIEIVSGGSNGIFGLMSKKAVVKARLRPRLADAPLGPGPAPGNRTQEPPQAGAAESGAAKPEAAESGAAAPEALTSGAAEPGTVQAAAPRPGARAPRPGAAQPEAPAAPEAPRAQAPAPAPGEPAAAFDDHGDEDDLDEAPEDAPRAAGADEPDTATLAAVVREVVHNVLTPIIGPTQLEVEAEPGRVKVLIRDEENSGLIIGREGQTIAALQYIVNRIVARRLPTTARVHLDAGDYRQRQDDNLQRMAMYLADKAKNQNRTQSTKPLSSYHRRLVHLALQHDEGIVTSSKGDGPLKRVLIHPRRNGGGQRRA